MLPVIPLEGYLPKPGDKVAIFDIEANRLLHRADKVHCIAVATPDGEPTLYDPSQIEEAIRVLCSYDKIVAYNGVSYDVPLLEKLYGCKLPQCFDPMLISRAVYSRTKLRMMDAKFNRIRPTANRIPSRLMGSHSLEVWGIRLGIRKGSYGKVHENAFAEYNAEMGEYCLQDVRVLQAIYREFMKLKLDPRMVDLEHSFQYVVTLQEMSGAVFDKEGAEALRRKLEEEKKALESQLQAIFPPIKKTVRVFTPKVTNAALGYTKGVPVEKTEIVTFNPSSRTQIAERLTAQGCVLDSTEKGNPSVSDDKLEELASAGVQGTKELLEHAKLTKLIGMITAGDNAWLKSIGTDGRIHGHVMSTGTISGRCAHTNPNLAQIPRRDPVFGNACRALFTAPKGMIMLGGDVKSLELRILGSFLAEFDNGAFINEILSGDIHTANQKAAGLPTRDAAKTFIFAFIYGAGDKKLGSIVAPDKSEAEQSKAGREIREKFLGNIPALDSLVKKVKSAFVMQGHLIGLDGRKLFPRADYSALNVLIQSAGALVVKYGTVLLHHIAKERGLKNGEDYVQALHVHDEVQFYCKPEVADTLGQCFKEAIIQAGKYFNLACPMDVDVKTGTSWAETH